ncbi:MAG: heme NO-binding domain-containing protein [Halieaceae bacterium]|jgi:predicted hydrocarbon binding protein|nr:heme NO-binding domain-containing protein [Halieaceae bacterium]
MVFTSLADLVEDEFGIAAWNRALARIDSVVDGAYVFADTYPASEMLELVSALEQELDTPADALLDLFGQKLFFDLYRLYPELVDCHKELIPFLASVGSDIHEEMKVLHVDAEVPDMSCEFYDRNRMTMYYDSPRKMCLLAEGLVRGAAQHFNRKIGLVHSECMHRGATRCKFEMQLL